MEEVLRKHLHLSSVKFWELTPNLVASIWCKHHIHPTPYHTSIGIQPFTPQWGSRCRSRVWQQRCYLMVARPVLEKTDQLTAVAVGQEQHWSQQVDVTFIITGSRKPLTKHAHTSGRYVAQKAPGQDLLSQVGLACYQRCLSDILLKVRTLGLVCDNKGVVSCCVILYSCILRVQSCLGKIMHKTFIFRPTGQQHQNISPCFSWASNIIHHHPILGFLMLTLHTAVYSCVCCWLNDVMGGANTTHPRNRAATVRPIPRGRPQVLAEIQAARSAGGNSRQLKQGWGARGEAGLVMAGLP
jgi:hypothetical protein